MANFRAFKRCNEIQSSIPLTDDQIRNVAPSVFGTSAHASRTERYTYIPTSDILNGLRKEGFQPFFACQSLVRDQTRRDYTRHMIRLRHASGIGKNEAKEIVVANAHDGSATYKMFAGVLNFVCTNGLVVGNSIEEVRVPHKGDVMHRVIDGAYTILSKFDRAEDSINAMKALTLDREEQEIFARAALHLRYDPADGPTPISEAQVLEVRRSEDVGSTLWQTFNVAEENLIRGGLDARRPGKRRYTTRPVRAIDGNIALNRALWTLAEEMRKLRSN